MSITMLKANEEKTEGKGSFRQASVKRASFI